ncbi:LacI family DNA-binding transcriptional regulator [Neobacillus sp. LXY-4]|uniref:LacI family DNA-binding transcriptional regulator n=1 Tax=Neobacillus sp. LXY-4 TaxID=3379826 RepID=UPI003EE23F4F
MKNPTIEDVAKKAGVSKSTVSQYLNQRYKYMSEKTKLKIEEVIKELNFVPNNLARSLKQKRTSMVGIIVANIIYNISNHIVRGIEDEFQKSGIQVIICNGDDNSEKERNYIEMLKARQVDGLMVFPTGKNVDLYNQLIEENYPLVFLDRIVDGVAVQSVLLDNEAAANLAVQEFIKKGHKKISIITMPITSPNITPRIERLSGYKKALERNGIEIREDYIYNVPKEDIQATVKQLLSLSDPPTALLAANDIVLKEVLLAAKHYEMSIPEDIAVIGIDDVTFARIHNPTITTVAQPAYEMGKTAAKILLEAIEKEKEITPITFRFPPTLKQGESV